ncbi:MAG: Smr/MutS family protein [Dehalococcoidia bacterium]
MSDPDSRGDRDPPEGALPADPDDLRRRSEELLEWPKVREALAGQSHFFRARELALALSPADDVDTVERLQEETAEARRLLDESGDIGLGGLEDPRPLLQRAALGGILTGRELLGLTATVASLWDARQVVGSLGRAVPRLGAVAAQIPDLRWLGERVAEAIDDRGQIRDSATPRLGGLRSGVATRYRRLSSRLERLIARSDIRAAIQAPVIATRGDRLVVEVRADRRGAVPGIVHDVSNTGQTLFVEPFDAVELCNEWREAAAEVVREEEKVLRRLSRTMGERSPDAEMAVEAAGALDLIVSRARLAIRMHAARAATIEPGAEATLNLVDARHPLLGAEAVPITLSLGPGFTILVITGPNTGGKTVALKTAGILALMHQAGLQVPADARSQIAVFDGVYADIGDAQSIERSVSTFSSHLGTVVRVLEAAGSESLVLLDELGTGTDPEEGAALARAVLNHLAARNIPTVATTHHRSVAEHAGQAPGMRNASVELDPDTMLPTYRLTMGSPGRSYAMNVAERLGLSAEVLNEARAMLAPEHTATEALLIQLQRERDELQGTLEEATTERAAAEAARRDLERRVAAFTEAQDDMIEETRGQLERQAEEIRASLRRIQAQARDEQDLAVARREAERVRRSIRRAESLRVTRPSEGERIEPEKAAPPHRPVTAGDIVEVRGLNARATVVEPHPDGTVSLMMGIARVTLNATQLRVVTPVEQAPRPEREPVRMIASVIDPPDRELDIRGIRAHEVFEQVTGFLDQAALLGLTSVRIIHGVGTGALRDATREALQRHPLVGGFERADPALGGGGATEVDML